MTGKTIYMDLRDAQPTDQVFSQEDPDTGRIRHINASAIERYIDKNPGSYRDYALPFDNEKYTWFCRFKGIEEPRVKFLLQNPQHLFKPGLGIVTNVRDEGPELAGDLVSIDGHHRAVARFRMAGGAYHFPMRIVMPSVWQKFLIPFPDEPHLRDMWLGGQESVYNLKKQGKL